MKRRELERKLRMAGCYLKREGSVPMHSGSIRRPGHGGSSAAQRDQGVIGNQDLEAFERGMNVEQQGTADDVLTRLAPKQSISMIQTFLALELPMTLEWEVYEQACCLSVDLNHHLFDPLYHAVALQDSDTFFITAATRYFRKAVKLGHIIELKNVASLHS